MKASAAGISFEQLNDFERKLLWALALQNLPTARTPWATLASKCGMRMPDGKLPNSTKLADTCRKLAELEIFAPRHLENQRYLLREELVVPTLRDAARQGALSQLHLKLKLHGEGWSKYAYGREALSATVSDLRVAFVLLNAKSLSNALSSDSLRYGSKSDKVTTLLEALGSDPGPRWVELLSEEERKGCSAEAVARSIRALSPLGEPFERALREGGSPQGRLDLARYWSLQGRAAEANTLKKLPKGGAESVRVLQLFLDGKRDKALSLADAQVSQLKRKYKALHSIEGVVHALCQVEAGALSGHHWNALNATLSLSHGRKLDFAFAYHPLFAVHRAATEAGPDRHQPTGRPLPNSSWVQVWTYCLSAYWTQGVDELHDLIPVLDEWTQIGAEGGFSALTPHLQELSRAMQGKKVRRASLVHAFKTRESWELALEVLEALPLVEEAPKERTGEQWIAWELVLYGNRCSITPKLRTPRSKKGRNVALKRLLGGSLECVSDADRRVLRYAEDEESWGYYSSDRKVLGEKAVLGLIDHPHVYGADGQAMRVQSAEPSLDASTTKDGTLIKLQPAELSKYELVLELTSPRVLSVYHRNPELLAILEAFKGPSLLIPTKGKERVGKLLGALSSRIRIDATGSVNIAGDKVEATLYPRALLDWDGSMLSVHLRIAPLGMEGPLLRAGVGSRTLAAVIEGKPLQTERRLKEERQGLRTLLLSCPILSALMEEGDQARASDLYEALDVLGELSEYKSRAEENAEGDALTLAWPQGRKLDRPRIARVDNLSVRVGLPQDWLSLDVELSLSEDLVLSYRELLALRRSDERYVDLGKKGFLKLTEDLESRLDMIDGLAAPTRSAKKLKLSPLTLPLVEGLFEGTSALTLDKNSSAHLAKFKKAQKLRAPVPKVFGTELRGYQLDGYRWMARLAAAELGACLADDMGLGKTIQTLAILLRRIKAGPALVVAPTSVAANWVHEAARFASPLRCQLLSDLNDRAAAIAALKSGDVLIASYSLLAIEAEPLSAKEFGTVVFDEAHYLKNAGTKRAKAAFGINAGFRISLSGTPIENHLGELWSLMQVTVPGLLGSAKHFTSRFAKPIAEGNSERAKQLKGLIDPFLLRRTKGQVLQELPERTDITLKIAPTSAEKAFYEALRQRAEENVQALRQKDRKGNQRLEILAEIGRLRQAAVDPRLIDPDLGPPGAKIDALMDKLLSLSEEGHRTLVFTQFLGSMKQIRARLDEAKIQYLSLDGSTPAKKRAQMIDDFQTGEAEVFLMSLKAGGIGVNLTGADYVIHVDPWWNPAVEEQATGRAHRIGQKRPVTVYRLITAGTIEEKILALHQQKRDLADTLLSGMDQARKLDLKELRALLSD